MTDQPIPTHADARAIVFKVGGAIDQIELHRQLDELLGMLSYFEDQHTLRSKELARRGDAINELEHRIEQMEAEAQSFDSILASNILQHFAEQNERLGSITSALARLGAVVERVDGDG